MKNLYLILVLLLFGAASAHSQTLKTLSYNTTNGAVVYSGTNSLTFTNPLQFATNVRANTRTNLGIANYTTPIAAHHATALSPAIGGQTYYFGFPHDLAAVTTSTDRGFKFPYPGRIIAATATISITGTLGVGQSGSPSMGIQNKTSGAFSFFALPSLSWSNSLSTFARTNLSIQVNTKDSYVFWVETPTFSTAPTSIRHYVTLFYRPD